MIGHSCDRYAPKGARVGDKYTCMCGRMYVCTRRWPWCKWEPFNDDLLK